MPLYEYRCESCRETFTVRQSMAEHERGQARCPRCQGGRVSSLISTFVAQTSRKS